LKFNLLISSGVVLLVTCIFLIYFYTHINVKTVSGDEQALMCGYVSYLDSYLCIDMDGKVVSVTANTDADLPVIEGLKFKQFTVGDYLETEDNGAFNAIAAIINKAKKYELGDHFIHKIDVTNLENIHLYTKNICVTLGSTYNVDHKIRTLKEIAGSINIDENVKGLLDISVIGKRYIFTILR